MKAGGRTVPDLSALKALEERSGLVFVVSPLTPDGAYGGTYLWHVDDKTTADDRTVVAPATGEDGRWKRIGGIVSVQSFGARGDRTSDDTAAIRAALAALPDGGALHFPPGVYRISAEIEGISNLEIVGNGATIVSDDVIRSYFYFSGKRNIAVHGCTFDMNMPKLPTYTESNLAPKNVALFFDVGAADVSVFKNQFVNLYTNAVRFYHVTGMMSVVGNTFRSSVQTQMLLLEHVFFTTVAGLIEVRNNIFANAPALSPSSVPAGIFASGTKGSAKIDGNTFDFCGRDNTGHHRVGVIDFYGNGENVTISNNTSTNTMGEFLRLSASWPAQIYGNMIERNEHAEPGNTILVCSTATYAGVAKVGASHVDIHDNALTATADSNHGIVIVAYDYSTPSTHIRVHHNTLVDFTFAVAVIGPFDDVSIDNNSISGKRFSSQIEVLKEGGHIAVEAKNGVAEADSVYRALAIRSNAIATPLNDIVPVQIDFSSTPPFAGTIGSIVVSQNFISAPPGGKATAVLARSSGTAPKAGSIAIRSNTISNFEVALDVRNFGSVIVRDNDAYAVGTEVVQKGNGSYSK